MKIKFLSALFLILCTVNLSGSQEAREFNFQTTEQGIIKSLTAEMPKVKTRGLGENKTRAIKVVGRENGQVVQQEVTVSDDTKTQSVNLKIEFDVNSFNIRSDSYELLDNLGKALNSESLKKKAVLIRGHTDSDGKDEYNLMLSLNRAQSVKAYLVGRFSIPDSRLKIFGFGETMPLVPDTDQANKQINRRVEIAVDEN